MAEERLVWLAVMDGRDIKRWISEHRPCPVCDCDRVSKPLYRVPADPPLAECDVVTCSSCGFTFSDTPTTQAEFDRYYAETKRYGPEVTGPASWNKERYAETARRICSLFEPVGKFIDIGCGQGGLLEAMADFEWQSLVGLEQSQWWDAKWDFDKRYILRKGSITTQYPVVEPFKCASICHVLEHVRDLDPAMRNLSAIAETVYAEVPDAARYHEHCESPYQQLNSEHLQHFTAEHLRRLFEHHGFAQVASGRGECGDPPPHMQPYVWGFFERAKPAADAVRAYCDRSGVQWIKVEAKLDSLKSPVIAWGAGQLFRKIERAVGDGVIVAVVDRCGGEGVITPDAVFGRYDASVPILVTTIQHRESVLADIARLGLKNEVITLP